MAASRPSPAPLRRRRSQRGLRTRLWLAALGGALASGLVTGSVLAAVTLAGVALSPSTLVIGLAASIVLGLVIALLCGRWLVTGIANPLREIDAGLASGLPLDPTRRDWGEITDVADRARELADTRRDLRRSQAELDQVYEAMLRARDGVERWIASERWEPLLPAASSLAPLAESLDRGFLRAMSVNDQNAEAARLIRDELVRVVEESRVSAELTEHGYVETTALMTTVREIGRLAAEIQQASIEPAAPDVTPPAELPAWRDEAVRAIEELAAESGQSVDDLGAGLVKVHEIAAQVQLLSNRATLIALNAVVGARGEARPASAEGSNAEMKQLARDVRTVTDRVAALSDEIGRSVAAASERMRVVRAHVSERLERLPDAVTPAPAAPIAPAAPVAHWLERLREMVQDAARKGERLSESQERVSSDVQRLTRRLEEEARDLEGLLVRLTPTADILAAGGAARGAEPRARRLHVLDAPAPAADAEGHSTGGEARP